MIPQHYPVEAESLYGGEYPGAMVPEEARKRVTHLVRSGVRTFIDLTAPADGMVCYEDLLAELSAETGLELRRISVPIPDMGVPESREHMQTVIDAIRNSMQEAPAVYVHCWGGIGRTGTAVGCWLRECGIEAEAALEHVQHLYTSHMPKSNHIPESPQTRAQRDFVRNWKP